MWNGGAAELLLNEIEGKKRRNRPKEEVNQYSQFENALYRMLYKICSNFFRCYTSIGNNFK